MNYDHGFHAGNFADVVKHIILSRIIAYLKRKPAPFRVIDTHAGAGLHDLNGPQAQRNPEWREGIAKLLEADLAPHVGELVAPYLDAVRQINGDGLSAYPGSPLLSTLLMRPEDRLTAMELHPEAGALLKEQFAGDHQVKVMQLDGYAALPAQLPPKQSRALVLIDPPFEEKGEFERMMQALLVAYRRFPTGVYALWYPLKDEAGVAGFKRGLFRSGVPDILCAELRLRAPSDPPRLFGSGMIIVNPPYVLRHEIDEIMAEILPVLTSATSAGAETSIIRPEAGGSGT